LKKSLITINNVLKQYCIFYVDFSNQHTTFCLIVKYLSIWDIFYQSGEVVALKKVPLRKLEDGIPHTALRYLKVKLLNISNLDINISFYVNSITNVFFMLVLVFLTRMQYIQVPSKWEMQPYNFCTIIATTFLARENNQLYSMFNFNKLMKYLFWSLMKTIYFFRCFRLTPKWYVLGFYLRVTVLSQQVDWLIALCCTPTLTVFYLHHGM
jgi:hypothetical protein